MTTETADLPEVFHADLVPLDAEIAALEALQEGLDAAVKQMLDEEAQHKAEIAGLTGVGPEPKTLDFLYGGDWHAAHAAWERRGVEQKEKLAALTEARDRAWNTYTDFFEWVVRPAKARLEQLRAKRTEIVEARTGLCDAAMRAAWRGGMIRR
jgi:hypothetical protein